MLHQGAITTNTSSLHNRRSNTELPNNEAEIRGLQTWAGLIPGDTVIVEVPPARGYVGTVECISDDGLIIWMRDELNERKLFHVLDCRSMRLVRSESRNSP